MHAAVRACRFIARDTTPALLAAAAARDRVARAVLAAAARASPPLARIARPSDTAEALAVAAHAARHRLSCPQRRGRAAVGGAGELRAIQTAVALVASAHAAVEAVDAAVALAVAVAAARARGHAAVGAAPSGEALGRE